MTGFRLSDQEPPEPKRITDTVVQRLEHVFEVDPELMTDHFHQQPFPVWDTERIVSSRWDHLDWMHDHWADSVLDTGLESETEGADEYPSEARAEPRPGPSDPGVRGLDPTGEAANERVDPSS
jgi:hypothetical protein